MNNTIRFILGLFAAVFFIGMASVSHASLPPEEIGIVVMHGKGGSPGRYVDELATVLDIAGFQVANLEMPWSGRRHYDVNMDSAVAEITQALDAMRANGVRKVFVIGHSQGGLFAAHYAGVNKVDGLIPIAPGGTVDSGQFVDALGKYVDLAREMVKEGRGDEKAEFADYEGSRGTNVITTTAAIYLQWFDPNGAHTTGVFNKVLEGTPVLYVAPTRDYPGLAKNRQRYFSALPSHPLTRMYAPESDHLGAAAAAADEVVAWITQIASQ